MTPELRRHQEWLGFVQPVGLVVSLPALEKAQATFGNVEATTAQRALRALATPEDAPKRVADLRALVGEVLEWEDGDLTAPPDSFAVPLPEYGETLRPTWAVPGSDGGWLILVSVVPEGTDLDKARHDVGWQASPEARLERMLRELDVPIGVLFSGDSLRLVYAPRGESSGHITFDVASMCESAGRSIAGALYMLLGASRLFRGPEAARLPAILKDSRQYQNTVSTKLAEQVLAALHELLRGFHAADHATNGRLLGEVLREDPSHVYGGLLATLLRLVFVLYAEDRSLLSTDALYVRHYAVTALFEKLRDDAARYPDDMDRRFGAWSRLLSLFRLVHDGGSHGSLRLPPRYGRLFDPDAYPFLEGRPWRTTRVMGEVLDPPKIADGVVYRVLGNLLLLDGERLSYRALDVEQIGSVYEAMMGFTIETVTEPSLAVKPHHVTIGCTTLLARSGSDRLKYFADVAGCKPTGKAQEAIKQAKTPDELKAALGSSLSPRTPEVLLPGTMILQPTEERRRSGSHYTPRALTEPIVEKTLRPVVDDLGPSPTAAQILALKVCDPAMGSGAFLVAACRWLGEQLVEAWQRHGMPVIPPDEDPVLHARRLVAQRCLYGVDKNPFAVDLAKLSLWLVTLAKDHPFTFLDHALRQGDSLVGLSREQIASFHWAPSGQVPLIRKQLDLAIEQARALRGQIHTLADSDDTSEKQRLLREADDALATVRKVGNLVVEAFFSGKTSKERQASLARFRDYVQTHGLANLPATPEADRVTPFHWEIEFPEVFEGDRTATPAERSS